MKLEEAPIWRNIEEWNDQLVRKPFHTWLSIIDDQKKKEEESIGSKLSV